MPSLPLDILLLILDLVDRHDLPALCQVDSVIREHATSILYRQITIRKSAAVCTTLCHSPELADKVKSLAVLKLMSGSYESHPRDVLVAVSNTLHRLRNLHTLSLHDPGGWWMLKGCTFQNTPHLETVNLCPGYPVGKLPSLSPKVLPNLKTIDAPEAWLHQLVPGRPVSHVSYRSSYHNSQASNIRILASSNTPIRSLRIEASSLQKLSSSEIGRLFPALQSIKITVSECIKTLDDVNLSIAIAYLGLTV